MSLFYSLGFLLCKFFHLLPPFYGKLITRTFHYIVVIN
uniref:Uncharacterized protein n=1 Tax=Siphoviridae sp. ctB3v5 TaxID=2826186 RepID=A0A8S5M959_9CAUD|nr:MAG TPA: hypothetical protein [Siphoviridae sp. ctB3v5]